MTWTPSHLTRSQMEERRLEGGRLLNQGKQSQREIAAELGVNEGTVSRWKETLEHEGSKGLKARRIPGRPSRLDEQGQQQLLGELRKGAQGTRPNGARRHFLTQSAAQQRSPGFARSSPRVC